jgi:integrase
MPKIADPYVVEHLADGRRRFSLASASGLPRDVILAWKRKGFSKLPDALARYRYPKTEFEAKKACRALIEFLQAAALPGPTGGAAQPLIPWLLDFWTPESGYARHKALVEKAPLSADYIHGSRRNIELYTAGYPDFKGITVGELTKKAVKSWLLWLAEKGLSGRKINIVRQAVQVPVKDACKNEEIASDPFLNVEKAYHVAKTRGVLTPAEVERLEAAPVTDPFRRLAVLLAVRYGLRRGEVRGLQWRDIADGIITVRHNYVEGDGLKNPKGAGGLIREKTRRVLAVGTVQAALAAARKKARYSGADDFVIQSLRGRGEPVSANYCDGAVKGELAGIGIPGAWHGRAKDKPKHYVNEQKARNLSFHGLRHTFVTLGRLAGLTDAEIQALAGHANSSMMENYSHIADVLDFAAMREKLEKKAGKAPPASEMPAGRAIGVE